ncbi:diaminopimelate decarboxylase, partial [Actinophytocola sp.]|uniref:diaminopimelate decarboxylase n=1 Tax=Actinophytocola sp. TaxID=1872138 RepID=UPI002EDB1230
MTLIDLLPSLRGFERAGLVAGVWPASARLDDSGDLVVGGVSMTRVAAVFGTPAYVLDEAEVRRQCRAYRAALPEVEISYAGKALLTRAVARWMREEGLGLDVCSAGELAVARRAGFPGERITLHGNAKSPEDLKAAVAGQVGRVVVDSFDELDQLAAVARARQQVLVRVTPGVDGHTHHAIATGVEDQKFGFSLAGGSAAEAVRRVLAQPALELAGLHCHIGSQLTRVADFEEAARRMVALLAAIRDEHGIVVPLLNLGGGHAVRYHAGDTGFDLDCFARRMHIAVRLECDRHRLPVPRLAIEPGRALVARAGITLYRVLTVKHQASRTFVAVDGGMSDNLRPALYGARYTARLVGRPATAPPREVTIAGRHCEAGDLLATDVPLPADVHAG